MYRHVSTVPIIILEGSIVLEQNTEVATDLALVESQADPCSTPSHFARDEGQISHLFPRKRGFIFLMRCEFRSERSGRFTFW